MKLNGNTRPYDPPPKKKKKYWSTREQTRSTRTHETKKEILDRMKPNKNTT